MKYRQKNNNNCFGILVIDIEIKKQDPVYLKNICTAKTTAEEEQTFLYIES